MLDLYMIHSRPKELAHYEEAKRTVPVIAWHYATPDDVHDLADLWAQDAVTAYRYAANVLHRRFPQGEAAIKQTPEVSFLYARDVIMDRWLPGEAAILKNPMWAAMYASNVINDAWPAAENIIAQSPEASEHYAMWTLHDASPHTWRDRYLEQYKKSSTGEPD